MKNWSVASPTQMGLLMVLFCWTTGSGVAAIPLEEEFLHLKENYIQIQDTVKSLESKVSQLKSLESKATQLELQVTRLESKDVEMQEKLTELEAKVQQQDSLLTSLLREKNERIAATDFDSSAPVSINQSAVTINGLPSSCGDLKMIGHIWNGIYFVMGTSMMESVYCDFTKFPEDAGFQKWIGFADVKSTPVHFYVQRTSSFNSTGIPIPFQLARLNIGNAMNLTSGIFTAPQPGIYFFSFAGSVYFPPSTTYFYLHVGLYLNEKLIGRSVVTETNSLDIQYSPMTLQSTLTLKKGDQVRLGIDEMLPVSGVRLYDDSRHFIHFTGFMLEEEIVASL